MTTRLELRADEIVPNRQFSHPDHIHADRSTLCMLIRDVGHRIHGPDPVSEWVPDLEHWYQRVIVPRPDLLLAAAILTVVGFFGRRRDGVDAALSTEVFEVSRRLEDAIPSVPGVLAYTTRLLSDERNYANLVILDGQDTIDRWRAVEPHPDASARLSGRFYDFIRIYRGVLDTRQITTEGTLELRSVRYWDYRSDPVWTATRDLST